MVFLLQFFFGYASVVLYVAFVWALFVPHLSFFWCLGRVALRDYGISLVSLLIFLLLLPEKISTTRGAQFILIKMPSVCLYNLVHILIYTKYEIIIKKEVGASQVSDKIIKYSYSGFDRLK